MRQIISFLICVMLLCLVTGNPEAHGLYQGRRILWVDSYNEGYAWTDGIAKGVYSVLQDSGVELRVIHLNTRLQSDPQLAEQAAREARTQMDVFHPEVVMASDDNAQRYFVVPYLKGTSVPVVFCGVNWDASEYGYPAPNITGMLEVTFLAKGYQLMSRFARGDRVCYLAAQSESEVKNLKNYNERYFSGTLTGYLVNTLPEFYATFELAQNQYDMIILGGYGGIQGWNDSAVHEFMTSHIRVPTCSFDDYMVDFAMFSFAKEPAEQGEWMASAALRILDGVAPASIPVVTNRRVRLFVNLELARAAGITLPVSLLKTATVIGRGQ